ncbi:SET domain-containing protein-lysine N-methyltransferase [Methylomonas sp. MgM2]
MMPSYDDVLRITGTDEAALHKIMCDHSDLIPFDLDYPVMLQQSPIHGMGLFATASFEAGQVICPARIGVHRTPAGRYTNHSSEPNAMMQAVDGGIVVVAIRDIAAVDEVTVCYLHARAAGLYASRV